MFDLDRFAADNRAACVQCHGGHCAISEVAARAASEPAAVPTVLGEPKRGEIQRVNHAPNLSTINVIWGRRVTVHPHNYHMTAVVSVYTGCEDIIFWRCIESGNGRVEAAGASALRAWDCAVLGNGHHPLGDHPIPRLTGAIHAYSGDFFATGRSEWDPETLAEHPYDVARTMCLFEESNAAFTVAC